MARVNHRSMDPIQDLYQKVNRLNKIDTHNRRPVRIPVRSTSQSSYTVGQDDGNIWVDVDDGALHWICNGVERKVAGTIV